MQPLYIIDAFAERPLAGNPAAVCPLQSWLPDDTMQRIAAEMNQSETVFFVPAGEAFAIRWFTPTREVDMIGHATLAAGHLVLERLHPERRSARFVSATAEMTVRRDGALLEIDMPALIPAPVAPDERIAAALGRRPSALLAAKHYLAVFDHAEEVAGLAPDFAALTRLDLPAVIVTAPAGGSAATAAADGAEAADFVSRFFAPANGVPEDPVSGVAHCCLSPYWSARLGAARLVGRQLSARGGTIVCEHRGDRVALRGRAAICLEGRLLL